MTTKVTRGRPPKFNREEAITIARGLFHANGYEGVGVAELGNAMGIKPPSLYSAFGSKQKLYELALEDYVSSSGNWIADTLISDIPLTEAIGKLFAEAAYQYTLNPNTPGCLILNSARVTTAPEVYDLAKHRCAQTREFIFQRIKQEQLMEPEVLCDYVMLVLHGLSAGASAGWSVEDANRAAKAATTGFSAQLKI